jgi:hypothetical protein
LLDTGYRDVHNDGYEAVVTLGKGVQLAVKHFCWSGTAARWAMSLLVAGFR